MIHIVLILGLKIFFDIIPGVSQETSWTLTNMSYMFGSYIMFHYVRGIPFEFNSGAFDNLNMWEQIDNGDQYTPTKKFLLGVPIVLFLLSTHYTHYDLTYFSINFLAVLAVVIPKLPFVCILPFLEIFRELMPETEPPDAIRPFFWRPRGLSGEPKCIHSWRTWRWGLPDFLYFGQEEKGGKKRTPQLSGIINSEHYLLRGLRHKVWSFGG